MKRQLWLFAVICSIQSALPVLASTQYTMTGYAHDLETNQLVYTEHHRIFMDGESITNHQVIYKNTEGVIIAAKQLDYSQNLYAPGFLLRDMRDGYQEGAQWTDEGYRLFRKRPNKEREYKTIAGVDHTLISDAGFNTYMSKHLESLASGKTHRVTMAVAGRLAAYEFIAKRKAEPEVIDRNAVRIEVVMANRLFRLLVDPLTLTYDQQDGLLLVYEGITNIRDQNGKLYRARVSFPPREFRNLELTRDTLP